LAWLACVGVPPLPEFVTALLPPPPPPHAEKSNTISKGRAVFIARMQYPPVVGISRKSSGFVKPGSCRPLRGDEASDGLPVA
jgi:hypothetical protein